MVCKEEADIHEYYARKKLNFTSSIPVDSPNAQGRPQDRLCFRPSLAIKLLCDPADPGHDAADFIGKVQLTLHEEDAGQSSDGVSDRSILWAGMFRLRNSLAQGCCAP